MLVEMHSLVVEQNCNSSQVDLNASVRKFVEERRELMILLNTKDFHRRAEKMLELEECTSFPRVLLTSVSMHAWSCSNPNYQVSLPPDNLLNEADQECLMVVILAKRIVPC